MPSPTLNSFSLWLKNERGETLAQYLNKRNPEVKNNIFGGLFCFNFNYCLFKWLLYDYNEIPTSEGTFLYQEDWAISFSFFPLFF